MSLERAVVEPVTRPLRLMQVTYSLGRGGSEAMARDLALRLHGPQVDCTVCAVDFDGPLSAELRARGVETFVMGRRPGVDRGLPLRLLRLFLRVRPHVVQTHHLTQLVYAGPPARLAGARLVHVEHEFFSLEARRLQRRLRALSHICHRIVAVAEEVRDFLVNQAAVAPAKVDVIRNGIDLQLYRPEPTRSRAELGLPADAPLVGTVGRLEAEKDHATLLQAFSQVLAECPSAWLVVVGDGSQRPQLVETAERLGIGKSVRFLGARGDVADLLPHLDVFAFPSLREGLPLAVLEAMACGRAIVTTPVGELRRLVEDGVTGLRVTPGDAPGLARAITACLADRPLTSRLGRRARQAVAEQFDLELMAERYRALYEALLGRAVARSSRRVPS